MEPQCTCGTSLRTFFNRLMMNPEDIYYLFEAGVKGKKEEYLWPVAGEATVNDKVFIVSAGAGSFYDGETTSKLFCEFMAAKVLRFGEREMSGELIDKLIIEARDRLISYARVHSLNIDPATTFSMVILYDQKVFVSWHGDSRVYHLRGGEILFSTKDKSLISQSIRDTAIAYGIKTDSSPIYADTKWIEDVQDGDCFLLCSEGTGENITDDDIKLLVSQNEKGNVDLAGSFKQLAFERTPGNYSMYLIKVNVGAQKRVKKVAITAVGKRNIAVRKQTIAIREHIIAIREHIIAIREKIIAMREKTSGNRTPVTILAMTIIGMFILFIYFRKARTSAPVPVVKNQTTQPVDVLRDDSVPSAFVVSAHRKPILPVTDSVKNKRENTPAVPLKDNSADMQAEEKPEQTNQASIGQKKRVTQFMVKFTTDDSCKLKITNIDLDEVFDWDLSKNDNGIIYLKPGKYSIVATSGIDESKTKTYDFDVKPGDENNTQNLHIKF